VIKIGHHGSKYASSEAFLTGIGASAAVISVGKNSYGHPAEDTLERLQSSGTDVFRTDRSGAVIVKITEGKVAVYEFSA
jgi:competence protein ComEC